MATRRDENWAQPHEVEETATAKHANRNAPIAQKIDETRTFITARLRSRSMDSPPIIPNGRRTRHRV